MFPFQTGGVSMRNCRKVIAAGFNTCSLAAVNQNWKCSALGAGRPEVDIEVSEAGISH